LPAVRKLFWGMLGRGEGGVRRMKIAFIVTRKRNNLVVSFETLKVQSFMLTEVRDCDLLIVVTSLLFSKEKTC